MNQNQIEIITILKNAKHPINSSKLSNQLNVSVRTIKNYIKDINAESNSTLIFSSREGYTLNNNCPIDLFIKPHDSKIPQTFEERTYFLIKRIILEHKRKIDLFDLCEALNISYSTIKSDINRLNKTYAHFEIEFSTKNNELLIHGSEESKRKLISFIINDESKERFVDKSQLKKCFDSELVDRLSHIIYSTAKTHDYYINDFSAMNILLHLLIIIQRTTDGYNLDKNDKIKTDLHLNFIEKLSHDISHKIDSKFNILLTDEDKLEIEILLATNINNVMPKSQEELEKLVSKEIVDLTKFYIDTINELYLIDLSSGNFLSLFSLHLKNLFSRIKYAKEIKNPLTDILKSNNPTIFDIAIFIAMDLNTRYSINLTTDEITFFAIHIGADLEKQNEDKAKLKVIVVCPEYRNISEILVNKILLNFSNQIVILEIKNNYQDIDGLNYDLVISTIENTDPKIPCIVISPFENNKWIFDLQEIIESTQRKLKLNLLRNNFNYLFNKETFSFFPKDISKNDVLSNLSSKLINQGYIDDIFVKSVFNREEIASTSFGNIAIPHSVNADAIQSCVAIGISKEGIKWDNNLVYIVLLLAINKSSKREFRLIYETLISVFNNQEFINEARNTKSFEDLNTLIFVELNKAS